MVSLHAERELTSLPKPETFLIKIRPYRDIILSTGRKESGKSYVLKFYAKAIKNFIVWDYNNEWRGLVPTANSLQTLDLMWRRGIRRIAYFPETRTKEHYNEFLKVVVNYHQFCLMTEELKIVTDPYKVSPELQTIFDVGRHEHKQIGFFASSRRSKGIPVDIVYNADHIFAFLQHRKADIQYLEEHMDSEYLTALKFGTKAGIYPDHTFVYFQGKSGKTYLHAPLPTIKTSKPLNTGLTEQISNIMW